MIKKCCFKVNLTVIMWRQKAQLTRVKSLIATCMCPLLKQVSGADHFTWSKTGSWWLIHSITQVDRQTQFISTPAPDHPTTCWQQATALYHISTSMWPSSSSNSNESIVWQWLRRVLLLVLQLEVTASTSALVHPLICSPQWSSGERVA